MVAPKIDINVFDLTVYAPQITDAIIGVVGPATKGQTEVLTDFTDEGTFVNFHGIPRNRMFTQRAAIRYLTRGNQLKFVRIAGPNLASAEKTLFAADQITQILKFTASSPGTWANDGELQVAVTHNGVESYNVFIYFKGEEVERYLALDNGIVETEINNASARVTVELLSGAGATFPAATVNAVTGAINRQNFEGGNDGAFATTDSVESSTSGFVGKRFYGLTDSVAGSRTFRNLTTIGAALAGQAIFRGSLGTPVVPGSFTVRLQTAAGPVYVELSDDGDLSYGPGGAGVGLLIPSAGAHVGFIDYRTGDFGVSLSGASLFSTGTIDAIWIRANSESVGATAAGTGAYAGNLSQFPLAPGFYNSNKVVFTVPIDEQVGDTPAGSPAGAASSDAALKTLAGWVVPNTVTLTPSHATDPVPPPIYDDGFGGFRTGPNGTGVPVVGATIDYRTGVWSVPTWDPVGAVTFPATAAQVQAEYDIHILDMGGGAVAGPSGTFINDEVVQPSDAGGDAAVASTDPGAQNILGPILPGNVKLTVSDVAGSPETIYDDGLGGWLDRPRGDPRAVAVAGAIDYTVGSWSATMSGVVTATATITVDYVSVPQQQARRSLRGTGPQFVADTTPNAAGVNLDDLAAANNGDGTNFLDHVTGQFGIELDLVTTGTNTFNVRDNGTISAVYAPASILGFGDGTETVFTGSLAPAPFRREDNRLLGFQGAQAASAAAGDPQVTFADTGASPDDDFWSQNVAASTDPDNFLDYRDGSTSIQWTGAPLLDESVYVIAEEVVLHILAQYPGDIGNERATLTDGFHVSVRDDPNVPGTIQLRVLFGTSVEETFGQQADIDELLDEVNGNSSDLITLIPTGAAAFLDLDLDAEQLAGLDGAFSCADIIGAKVGQVYTGLQHFQNDEVVPVNWLGIPGQWHTQCIDALKTLCERKGRRCLGVVPSPDLDTPFGPDNQGNANRGHREFFNGNYNAATTGGIARPTVLVPFPPLTPLDSNQLATIVPWIEDFDQFEADFVFEPPDGEMLRLVANTPAPWFPVAGFRRGRVRGSRLRYSASRDDRELIQGVVGNGKEIVNPIVLKEGRGLVLLGQQTAQRRNSSLDRINVRWTINVIMNILDAASQEFLFEINDAILWREITTEINRVLKPIVERRGLQDAFLVVDGTTTTPDDVDALRVNAKLFVKPQRAAEFITYDLILTPSGADFADLIPVGSGPTTPSLQ